MPQLKMHRSGTGNIGRTSEQRKHSYAFTSYNADAPVFDDSMTYLCYSPEVCPSTGRPHWQGYVHWRGAKNMSASSKKLGGVSVRPCDGTPDENRIYCGAEDYDKDGKHKDKNPLFKEFGTLPQQGHRSDLDDIKDDLVSGALTVNTIIMEQPMMYHQYGRTIERINDLRMRQLWRTEMTTCNWYYGPTGVGKSHAAFENYHPSTHYNWKNDHGWWDKYQQQETVIINDFRGEIPYNELLQLIDKWPYDVNRRGKEPMPFMSKHIIITSSLAPWEIYKNRMAEDDLKQLLERVNVTYLDGESKRK